MIKRAITSLLLVVALLRPVPLMAQDTGPVPDSDSFCDRNPAVCTVAEEIECTPVWMLYSGVFAGFIGLIAQAPDIIAKADETPKWAPASTSYESWEAWPCAEPVQTVNFTMSGGNALGDGSLLTGFGGFEFGFSGRYLTGESSFLIAGSRRTLAVPYSEVGAGWSLGTQLHPLTFDITDQWRVFLYGGIRGGMLFYKSDGRIDLLALNAGVETFWRADRIGGFGFFLETMAAQTRATGPGFTGASTTWGWAPLVNGGVRARMRF